MTREFEKNIGGLKLRLLTFFPESLEEALECALNIEICPFFKIKDYSLSDNGDLIETDNGAWCSTIVLCFFEIGFRLTLKHDPE